MKISKSKKNTTISRLKLIIDGDMRGYTLGNIKECLSHRHYARFQSWLIGQTVGIYENKPIVYAHDFERFIKGLPSLD